MLIPRTPSSTKVSVRPPDGPRHRPSTQTARNPAERVGPSHQKVPGRDARMSPGPIGPGPTEKGRYARWIVWLIVRAQTDPRIRARGKAPVHKGIEKGRGPLQKLSDRCGCRASYLASDHADEHGPLMQGVPKQQSALVRQPWPSVAQ
jgi:hypothetical protein